MRTRRIAIISAAAIAGVGLLAVGGAAAVTALQNDSGVERGSQTAMAYGQGNGRGATQTDGTGQGGAAGNGANAGEHGQQDGTCTVDLTAYPAGTLTAAQEEELLYMIEEEKLALDVYTTLGDRFDLRVFDNIAASEAQHVETMRQMAELYGLDDPSSDVVGEFSNPTLQSLYESLTAADTVEAALEVGRTIEIDDLQHLEQASAGLDAPALEQAYEQLTAASERHLDAFGG